MKIRNDAIALSIEDVTGTELDSIVAAGGIHEQDHLQHSISNGKVYFSGLITIPLGDPKVVAAVLKVLGVIE